MPARLLLPAPLLVGAMAALLAACSAVPAPSGATPAAPVASTGPAGTPDAGVPGQPSLPPVIPPRDTVPPTIAPLLGEVPGSIVVAARTDLARRIGAQAAAAAAVARAEAVTWPDGALGCPIPGEKYVQVQTPGYWIVFRSGGHDHDYRATGLGAIHPCERALPAAP